MYKFILSSVVVFIFTACGGDTTPASSTSVTQTIHPIDAPPIENHIKDAYLSAINSARTKKQNCGSKGIKQATAKLTWNDALYKAAYEHSKDLATSNTISHAGSATTSDWTAEVQELKQGSSYKERIENNGYLKWKSIGENITAGTLIDTAQKAVDAWMKSDGHCANIMSPKYTEVGMAHVKEEGTTYTHYWTQNFGAR